ncbi:MAG: ComF family protein [Deltaproteobacteria bacterium]|nr:ComF family protein [Deltaproteobacteria bacterium]
MLCHRRDAVLRVDRINAALCRECLPWVNLPPGMSYLPTLETALRVCDRCGERLEDDEERSCRMCSMEPLPLRAARSLFVYRDRAESIVCLLKYGGQSRLASVIARAFYFALVPNDPLSPFSGTEREDPSHSILPHRDWNLIVPMPSAPRILRERGFSHMTLVARQLAPALRRQTEAFALRVGRDRDPQASLPLPLREKNVRNSFSANPRLVSGRSILLIDDMLTTGASLQAAAEALLQAGARTVDGITFARSPNFQRYRRAIQLGKGDGRARKKCSQDGSSLPHGWSFDVISAQ